MDETHDYLAINNKSGVMIENDKIVNLDNNSLYTVKYMYNGNIMEKNIKVENGYNGKFQIRYIVDDSIKQSELLKAIMADNFEIISIEKNKVASTLMLSSEDGLQKGLNRVKLLINGVEEIIMLKYNGSNGDLNQVYKDVLSADILSVEPITYNVEINNTEAKQLFRVEYLENGINKEFYITPTINEKKCILDIDYYMAEKNITDASNIKIEKGRCCRP